MLAGHFTGEHHSAIPGSIYLQHLSDAIVTACLLHSVPFVKRLPLYRLSFINVSVQSKTDSSKYADYVKRPYSRLLCQLLQLYCCSSHLK